MPKQARPSATPRGKVGAKQRLAANATVPDPNDRHVLMPRLADARTRLRLALRYAGATEGEVGLPFGLSLARMEGNASIYPKAADVIRDIIAQGLAETKLEFLVGVGPEGGAVRCVVRQYLNHGGWYDR